SVLDLVHKNGIIHRDLKPGDIFLGKTGVSGSLKVSDFGLSHMRNISADETGVNIIETFTYMSPEQCGIIKRKVDERSDLYSLGVILYRLLTGVPPFTGENISVIIHKQI